MTIALDPRRGRGGVGLDVSALTERRNRYTRPAKLILKMHQAIHALGIGGLTYDPVTGSTFGWEPEMEGGPWFPWEQVVYAAGETVQIVAFIWKCPGRGYITLHVRCCHNDPKHPGLVLRPRHFRSDLKRLKLCPHIMNFARTL